MTRRIAVIKMASNLRDEYMAIGFPLFTELDKLVKSLGYEG